MMSLTRINVPQRNPAYIFGMSTEHRLPAGEYRVRSEDKSHDAHRSGTFAYHCFGVHDAFEKISNAGAAADSSGEETADAEVRAIR